MKVDLDALNRWSAWLALLFCVMFLVSGFVMTGRFGFDKFMSYRLAVKLHHHSVVVYGLVLTLLVHGGVCGVKACRRICHEKKKKET